MLMLPLTTHLSTSSLEGNSFRGMPIGLPTAQSICASTGDAYHTTETEREYIYIYIERERETDRDMERQAETERHKYCSLAFTTQLSTIQQHSFVSITQRRIIHCVFHQNGNASCRAHKAHSKEGGKGRGGGGLVGRGCKKKPHDIETLRYQIWNNGI